MSDYYNKEGGAAFPVPCIELPGAPQAECGMTLRQWYAGQALAGELASMSTEVAADATAEASVKSGRTVAEQIAYNCFLIADAMIAEGKK